MQAIVQSEIDKLQSGLPLIRRAGGWSAEELGDMIGVTKQTISNLENNKTRMSKTQYIALRAVLDYEIADRPDDKLLSSTLNLCMNSDELPEDEKKKAKAFVEGAAKTKLDNATVVAGLSALIGVVAAEAIVMGPAAGAVIGAAGAWLGRIIKPK